MRATGAGVRRERWRSRRTRLVVAVLLPLLALAFLLVRPTGRSESADLAGSGIYVFGARGGIALTSPSSAGTNPLFTWAELEPAEGVFDWSAVDAEVAAAEAAGKHTILRIYTNEDAFAQPTPEWFFALPGAQFYYPSVGAARQGFRAPVPWDPTFQVQFGAFVRAFGQRYDGNPAIRLVQTNAAGGVYGEMVMSVEALTAPGWRLDLQRTSTLYWMDVWEQAFPTTPRALMVNSLGAGLAEGLSELAAKRGFYLEQHTPWLGPASVALFTANANRTGVVMELEDRGCRSATGPAFDTMMARVLAYGFPLDLITLCPQSLADADTAQKLPGVLANLRAAGDLPPLQPPAGVTAPGTGQPNRTSGPNPQPAATPPPTAPAPPPAITLRDDFESPYLPPEWAVTDPLHDAGISLATTGHLRIAVPSGQPHDCWSGVSACARVLRTVSPDDLVLETQILGEPITGVNQAYGLLLWQDDMNYLRFEFLSTDTGVRVMCYGVIDGAGVNPLEGPLVTLGTANVLRASRMSSLFTLDFSTDGGLHWARAGAFLQPFTPHQAGVHVVTGGSGPSATANFDYFSVTTSAR